jgi:hypothetical protein
MYWFNRENIKQEPMDSGHTDDDDDDYYYYYYHYFATNSPE